MFCKVLTSAVICEFVVLCSASGSVGFCTELPAEYCFLSSALFFIEAVSEVYRIKNISRKNILKGFQEHMIFRVNVIYILGNYGMENLSFEITKSEMHQL